MCARVCVHVRACVCKIVGGHDRRGKEDKKAEVTDRSSFKPLILELLASSVPGWWLQTRNKCEAG